MSYKEKYQEKLITAAEAAKLVKSGDIVEYGWGIGTTFDIDKELAKRAGELENVQIHGGVLLKPLEIFSADPEGKSFTWNSWHAGGPDRKVLASGAGFYTPMRYSEVPRYYREVVDVDVAYFQVAPMDEHGFFNFGLNTSHQMAIIDKAKKVVVEVNEKMPYALGRAESEVHIDNVDFIVEGSNPELAELPTGSFGEVDKKVAELIVPMIPDGAVLQLGIGSMPNAIGSMIADSDLKDLGVHTEMYVDAFMNMDKKGRITGKKKNIDRGRQVYAFAAGTRELYDYINHNPEIMAASVEYTNGADTIAQLDNFISINNAINVDLWGQVSSETSGFRHISGAGGQLDFTLGAYLSKGGKGFICLSSKYYDKKAEKEVSRIVPNFEEGSIITVPRPCTFYIVTEYGVLDLKGLTTWQRAEGIINLAAPEFRDELIAAAEKAKIWRNSNKR